MENDNHDGCIETNSKYDEENKQWLKESKNDLAFFGPRNRKCGFSSDEHSDEIETKNCVHLLFSFLSRCAFVTLRDKIQPRLHGSMITIRY